MQKIRITIFATFLFLILFVPFKAFALETGFLPATSCTTDGSSCSAMNIQDTNYNSWSNTSYEEIRVTLNGFDIPDNSVIDDIQIKMRIKTSTGGWTWFVSASNDNGVTYFSPTSCVFYGVCSYNTTAQFNSITFAYPTMSWLNNNMAHIITGEDINDSRFSLKLWQSQGIKNTDIDTLLFNIRYRIDFPSPLPQNVYEMTNGFVTSPPLISGIGQVFYSWDFNIPYTEGKVFLSSNPEGTGTLEFADDLVLVNTSFNSGIFTYHGAPFCVLQHNIPPIDVTSFFSPLVLNRGSIKLRDFCGRSKIIGPIYLVVIPDPVPTPTATPTPTSIPTPAPFLDLPWDYEEKGLSFNDAALAINSYFDHEYPLLSSGLSEPADTVVPYIGYPKRTISEDYWYSSHDGYDYGSDAQVEDGDPVLAAASGKATLVREANSGGGGNVIKINHGNGYQTWYEHLYYDDYLFVKNENEEKDVARGQRIASVGHTGNCYIIGHSGQRIYNTPDCAHIHFSVFQDKNDDGNFGDNVPDGATDPFGWQPFTDEDEKDPDPWEDYSFFYKGKQRTGNKSYYLWKKKLPGVKEVVTSAGGTYTAGDVSIEIEPDTFATPVTLNMHYAPSTKASGSIWSVGPVVSIKAKNILGDYVTLLTKPVKLIWFPFRESDFSRFKVGSFYLYSTTDGSKWKQEQKVDPFTPGNITAATNHFTYFAIMGERKDIVPPTTTDQLSGEHGQENWFRSDVTLSLSATDTADENPAGVDYILYKIEDGENQTDWQTYEQPLIFTEEGHHKVSFYSRDKDGNLEDVQTIEFDIDKTLPQVSINTSLNTLWPPNGKMVDVTVVGSSSDENIFNTIFSIEDDYDLVEPEIANFGQTIKLQAKTEGYDLDGRSYVISAIAQDKAGNQSTTSTTVIVLHDQRE